MSKIAMLKNVITPLEEYYRNKTQFEQDNIRLEIIDSTGCSLRTFYRWLKGEIIPRKLEREKIAELMEVPTVILWPEV